ncbi:MAG: hypothetical protein ABI619_08825, partial [Betaproteobacteria bacterium]
IPLAGQGEQAAHVLAYARQHEGLGLVVLCGRLFAQLLRDPGRLPLGRDVWADTTVPTGELNQGARFVNVLTGESVEARDGALELAQVFENFPVAVLMAAV